MSKSTFFVLLLASSLELPEIADFRKPRPSNTSPRIAPLTTPSWPRSTFSDALSPSDGA